MIILKPSKCLSDYRLYVSTLGQLQPNPLLHPYLIFESSELKNSLQPTSHPAPTDEGVSYSPS
jgi:hypothetical protein